MGVFFKLNGWRLTTSDDVVVAIAVDTGEGLLDVPALAKILADSTEQEDIEDDDEG